MGMINVERRGPVVLLGLDRPGKLNALDQALVEEFAATLGPLRHEPAVLVVHSTTPGMFVSGADIAELIDRDAEIGLRGVLATLLDALEAHRWPTVAAIDGPAFGGGCELALACDMRIASDRSRFAQPELGLGILAGAGGNWRLAQTVGLPVARRMLYAGEVLDAGEALRAGLVDQVHPADEVLDAAVGYAQRIAGQSWRALELTKVALRLHRPATTLYDMTAQALLFEGADKKARMTEFLAERERRRAARVARTAEGAQ